MWVKRPKAKSFQIKVISQHCVPNSVKISLKGHWFNLQLPQFLPSVSKRLWMKMLNVMLSSSCNHSSPQVALHEKPSCHNDRYGHMGLRLPWKPFLLKHNLPLSALGMSFIYEEQKKSGNQFGGYASVGEKNMGLDTRKKSKSTHFCYK